MGSGTKLVQDIFDNEIINAVFDELKIITGSFFILAFGIFFWRTMNFIRKKGVGDIEDFFSFLIGDVGFKLLVVAFILLPFNVAGFGTGNKPVGLWMYQLGLEAAFNTSDKLAVKLQGVLQNVADKNFSGEKGAKAGGTVKSSQGSSTTPTLTFPLVLMSGIDGVVEDIKKTTQQIENEMENNQPVVKTKGGEEKSGFWQKVLGIATGVLAVVGTVAAAYAGTALAGPIGGAIGALVGFGAGVGTPVGIDYIAGEAGLFWLASALKSLFLPAMLILSFYAALFWIVIDFIVRAPMFYVSVINMIIGRESHFVENVIIYFRNLLWPFVLIIVFTISVFVISYLDANVFEPIVKSISDLGVGFLTYIIVSVGIVLIGAGLAIRAMRAVTEFLNVVVR